MNMWKFGVCALAIMAVSSAAMAASPSTAAFHVDATKRGKIIGNKVSTVNLWQAQTWTPQKDEGADLTKFVEHIQFMMASGGNPSRDLFADPNDGAVLDDYQFDSLVRACRDVLKLGAKPFIKLSVPAKFSKESDVGVFGTDCLPPDDYDAYYRYIRALAETLVKEFGLDEVKTWGWGVLVEFENCDWFHTKDKSPEKSRDAFLRLYDESAAALTDVLGDEIFIGAHAMACTEGLWDERDLLDHCAKDKNARTGKPIPIKYFAVSFYDDAPDRPHPLSLAGTVARIRERAESVGLTDLRYGVDEGRILGASKGQAATDLVHRIVGQTYQAGYDARIFKILIDNDIDYFSAWSYSSSGPFAGYPMLAYRVAEKQVLYKNAKLLETTAEKRLAEGVECDAVAGFDEETETLYATAYNFKFDLNYSESADVTLTVDAPFWKNRDVEIKETVISDGDNFFCQWLKDKERLGIKDDAFRWSPDSGCLDSGLTDPEARDVYFKSLREGYVKIANTPPKETVTSVKVGEDGAINLAETLPRHAVVFYEIKAK
ncbi:MAG: hypothetical protein IIU43_03565 [Thermoguttaceae bacterium]|nr:hypothetical protein [Thermoguttaceae bacterium]